MTNTVTVTETQNTVSVNETTNTVTVTEGTNSVISAVTQGPQGARGLDGATGPVGAGMPTLGDPGNIIIKSSYTNYDIDWVSSLDGGTFN